MRCVCAGRARWTGRPYTVANPPCGLLNWWKIIVCKKQSLAAQPRPGQKILLRYNNIIITFSVSLAYKKSSKKNMNASRPSESGRGGDFKTSRWDHRLQRPKKTLHGMQPGSPIVVTLGQQYNVREKPTVVLYTYINRHAGTPNKTKTKETMSLDYTTQFVTLGLGSDGCR